MIIVKRGKVAPEHQSVCASVGI